MRKGGNNIIGKNSRFRLRRAAFLMLVSTCAGLTVVCGCHEATLSVKDGDGKLSQCGCDTGKKEVEV